MQIKWFPIIWDEDEHQWKKLRFFQELISFRQAVIVLWCQLFHAFMQRWKKEMHDATVPYDLHHKQLQWATDWQLSHNGSKCQKPLFTLLFSAGRSSEANGADPPHSKITKFKNFFFFLADEKKSAQSLPSLLQVFLLSHSHNSY